MPNRAGEDRERADTEEPNANVSDSDRSSDTRGGERVRRRTPASSSAAKPSDRPSGSAGGRGRSARQASGETTRRSGSADETAERAEPAGRPAGRPSGDTGRQAETGESHGRQRRSLGAGKAARLAMQEVADLTNRKPESVTSVERLDGGWRVGVEVIESHRIPDSTDILAVYEADLDGDGDLVSYRRTQRYYRGRAQED